MTPTFHLIDARHRDPILNTMKTVCGIKGYGGLFAGDLDVDGKTVRVTGRPAGVTCPKCQPKLPAKISAGMLAMLEAAKDATYKAPFRPVGAKGHMTYRALYKRGLIDRGMISDRGRAILQAKGKTK